MKMLHLFHVVVSRAHPFGINHVRTGEDRGDKLLQVFRAQASLLGKDVAFRDRFDHADDEDVADVFEQSRSTGFGVAEIYYCPADPKCPKFSAKNPSQDTKIPKVLHLHSH
jgi:hypothetical protein